jgi:hypothetical protein
MEQKTTKELVDLNRWVLVNAWKSQQHSNQLSNLRPKWLNWLKPVWIWDYIKAMFYKCPYPTYTTHQGIFTMPDTEGGDIGIALVSDWASDTVESDQVGFLMAQFIHDDFLPNVNPKNRSLDDKRVKSKADYTIHLGDVYFIGKEKEVDKSFGIDASWAYGKRGSFALSGNHEMYSSGYGFYHHLLKSMGAENCKQEAGFFCLENKYWRIIGIDTGYYSVGIPYFTKTNDLHKKQIDWLRDVVKIGDESDKRGLIFLSHHQYYSAFVGESGYPKAAFRIAELLPPNMVENRRVIWFWGHEHRLAFYDLTKIPKGISAYGRCIGHGGMPQTSHKFDKDKAQRYNLRYYDAQSKILDATLTVARNGYARLILNKNRVQIDYVQAENTIKNEEAGFKGTIVATEEWTVDMESGHLMKTLPLKPNEASIVDIQALLTEPALQAMAIVPSISEAGFYQNPIGVNV